MRKLITPLAAVLLLSACKKEDVDTTNGYQIPAYSKIISGLVLPDDANQEVERITTAAFQPDFTFGITDNPNYGTFSTSPEYDIHMSGSTPNTIGLRLDGNSINQTNGQWLHQSIDYKQYYGKNVDVEILNNGSTILLENIYVPKPATTPILSTDLHIQRTGNVLSWEVDQNFPANKIALAYSLYNTSELNDLASEIERDVILIDNNGSYSIDHLLSNQEAKKIYFRLISGNALATEVNRQKILFTIKSYDHHVYVLD